jgi:membrane protein implicated in regulation of membrane protease activity
MITHLKTTALFLTILALACLAAMFPKVTFSILWVVALMIFYYIIYRSVKEGEKEEELMGPNNAGGRDLD